MDWKRMNERLTIKGFCGIDDIDLQVGDITVLIGPQAMGKSICAKSLYYFKTFFTAMLAAIQEGKTRSEFDEVLEDRFEEYFPLESPSRAFVLRYEVKNSEGRGQFIRIRRPANRSHVRITYSEPIRKLYETLRRDYRRQFGTKSKDKSGGFLQRMEFQELARSRFGELMAGRQEGLQLFIPAGRSFFAILHGNIFSFLEASTAALDPFLKRFGSYYESMKRYDQYAYERYRRSSKQSKRFQRVREKVEKLIYSILRGQFRSERDKDYLVSSDGRKTSLANSSSGQQETLPLAVILRSLHAGSRDLRTAGTVYIEEPEAHIFPAAQRQIVQLIALLFNASKAQGPLQFVLTTHSPYIVTVLNNLMLAGKLARRLRGRRKVELLKLVDEDQVLNPGEIRCYSVHDGISEPMIDRETGLLRSDVIDEVSDQLSIEFGKMLELD